MATQATYTLATPPTPAAEPPPGVIPTFDQPYTLLPYAEVTIALCAAITTFLIAARLYVKICIVKKFLWEDFTCILGWVSRIEANGKHSISRRRLPWFQLYGLPRR